MASKVRAAHLRSDSTSYVLSIEYIGRAWATVSKALDRLAADALRGTVGRDELGMRRFQLAQLGQQLVVLLVGDRRRGVDVVAPIVLANRVAEVGRFVGCGM